MRAVNRQVATLVTAAMLVCAVQPARAGGCAPPPCCFQEITVYRPVCRIQWKEVTVTEYHRRYETKMVTKEVLVPITVTQTQQRSFVRTVYKPVWETVERKCRYVEWKPVQEKKKVVVDCGHWAVQTVCGPCGKVRCQRVWVPKLVEKEITCVRYVPVEKTKVIQTRVCRLQPQQQTITYQVPVCRVRYEKRQVQVPVTRCVIEPRVVKKKVPVPVTQWVPCRIKVPVPCCP